ncbi:hypothetical protein CSW58_02230 [Caulobacter sp. B11]|nr:hypothetical protein CSW58_02230 [Caulobacter sp. B11]
MAQCPQRAPASGGGSARASAFFQAALGDAAATRPTTAPVAVQLQAQAQAQAQAQPRPAPARPFVAPTEQPQRMLRPGSLLNIVV